MRDSHLSSKNFLVGAAVGSLLGTVSALLVAPKAGRRLRQDICDMYCDMNDKGHDIASNVNKKSKSFVNSLYSQSSDWSDAAKEKIQNLKGWVHPEEEEEESCGTSCLIGGVAGGLLLGAVAGLLLAPKAGSALRDDIVDTYDDISDRTHDLANQWSKKGKKTARNVQSQASEWIDLAKEVLDRFVGDAQETTEEVVGQGKRKIQAGYNKVNDMMDWVSLGMRVWNGIQKGR